MAQLNNICFDCLNMDCQGTFNAVWSGCVYKQTETDEATQAALLFTNKLHEEGGNLAAVFADLDNAAEEMKDRARTTREKTQLNIIKLAKGAAADNIKRRYMAKHGYIYKNKTWLQEPERGQQLTDNEKNAEKVAEAIKKLVENPAALDNFKSYLGQHFNTWLEKYANTPEGLAAELESFANIS